MESLVNLDSQFDGQEHINSFSFEAVRVLVRVMLLPSSSSLVLLMIILVTMMSSGQLRVGPFSAIGGLVFYPPLCCSRPLLEDK